MKFHHRGVEKLTIKLRKLKQGRKQKRNDMEFPRNIKPFATVLNKPCEINKLAIELTTKLTQVDKLLVNLRTQIKKLERFSNDCRKTNTNHNRNKQRHEPITIPSNHL